jgi:hypothetical protein
MCDLGAVEFCKSNAAIKPGQEPGGSPTGGESHWAKGCWAAQSAGKTAYASAKAAASTTTAATGVCLRNRAADSLRW